MNLKHLALIATATLAFAACEEDAIVAEITPDAASAEYFTNGISIPAAAKEVKVVFTTTMDWTVSAQETKALVSWLTVSPASGKAGKAEVTIAVEANPELSPRSATLTVTSAELKKEVKVTQAARDQIKISGVTLDKTSAELFPGESVSLMATVTPSNADEDKTVTWTSSNNVVAIVRDGVVTAVSEGSATITAKAGDKTASCAVTVKHKVVEVESVTLNMDKALIYAGETVTLTATVNPSNADEKTVTWASSDESVATVKDGVVTGVAYGKAVITATASGKSATCSITVDEKGSHGEDLGGTTDVDPWTEPAA